MEASTDQNQVPCRISYTMAPKSMEDGVDHSVQIRKRSRSFQRRNEIFSKSNIVQFSCPLVYYMLKHEIPKSYISFHISEKERYLSMMTKIDSYYEELNCIYSLRPEFQDDIDFDENKFKCIKEYLLFLESKTFYLQRLGISCKRRKLSCDLF